MLLLGNPSCMVLFENMFVDPALGRRPMVLGPKVHDFGGATAFVAGDRAGQLGLDFGGGVVVVDVLVVALEALH
jgi:hypothetical protein